MMKKWKYVIWFYCFLMITPAFGDAGTEDSGLEDNLTFHVFEDVDLVSTLKFAYGKPAVVIKSVYPQLASETEREGVKNFNKAALQIVNDEIAVFREKVKANAAIQKTMEKNKITNNLYIDYNTSYIKAKHNHIISIRFSMQGQIAGNHRPYHHFAVLNYNLDTSKPIELNELFIPDSHYLNLLSQYSRNILFNKLTNKTMIAAGTAPVSENFSNWNIKPNGLIITFNENQAAPSVFGAQTILVPYSVLSEVISPTSFIGDCMKHHSRCARNNLLTGGFIDEARNKNPKINLTGLLVLRQLFQSMI